MYTILKKVVHSEYFTSVQTLDVRAIETYDEAVKRLADYVVNLTRDMTVYGLEQREGYFGFSSSEGHRVVIKVIEI